MNIWDSYKIGFRAFPGTSDHSSLAPRGNRGKAKEILLFFYHLVLRISPIDYVRWREFAFAMEAIDTYMPSPEKILDISSPKLLPMTFAANWKSSSVVSTDILESEVSSVETMGKRLRLDNLSCERMDARSLRFPDNSFDLITSISVLEHIAPENGGEGPAIREIHRVLSSGGVVILTVPFSRTYFAEYKKGNVYERKSDRGENQFFQRFYDWKTLMDNIVRSSSLELVSLRFIEERIFAKNPRKRLSHYISGTWLRTLVFGPFYPLLSRVFLTGPKHLEDCRNPYLACLVMKKTCS